MWVLPSRGRPHNLDRFVKAYDATGGSTLVTLWFDKDDPTVRSFPVPRGWRCFYAPRLPLAAIYNEVFNSFPDERWYGFIADDVVPETVGWDRLLIEGASCEGMAVPAGGETTGGCPHFVLGGDLVRSVGWLALPGLDRLYIDTVWKDIAQARGVYRYRPDIILKHHHFSNGLAPVDETYRKHRKAQDRAVYEAWRKEQIT